MFQNLAEQSLKSIICNTVKICCRLYFLDPSQGREHVRTNAANL